MTRSLKEHKALHTPTLRRFAFTGQPVCSFWYGPQLMAVGQANGKGKQRGRQLASIDQAKRGILRRQDCTTSATLAVSLNSIASPAL